MISASYKPKMGYNLRKYAKIFAISTGYGAKSRFFEQIVHCYLRIDLA